jgi:hypothetical protein
VHQSIEDRVGERRVADRVMLGSTALPKYRICVTVVKMARGSIWFRRLGDIPGIEWSSPGVDRIRLPRHDARPELRGYEFEGRRQESLWWEGGTSASPAQAWAQQAWAQIDDEQSSEQILNRLYEALELPGEPSDYHFAIQGVAAMLWRRRRQDPSLLMRVEELSWLDIRLVEACPAAITFENQGSESYFGVAAFQTLLSLYEREGYIDDAIAVLKRSEHFRHDVSADRERLEAKQAAITAEDSR